MGTARVSLAAGEEDLPARRWAWPHKPFTPLRQCQELVFLTLGTYDFMKYKGDVITMIILESWVGHLFPRSWERPSSFEFTDSRRGRCPVL